MSDGERAIFYFIGQCLVAPQDGVIIIDEPESHVHKAILAPLWDAIEKARPDYAFIYITHDVNFAVKRTASAQYYIKAYTHQPPHWDMHALPQDTGLPDQVVAELVGSRKPILFVEGEQGSLDLTVYSSQYKNYTIVPIGSCEAVIHSVASYKASPALHWLGVRGIVDADQRNGPELASLRAGDIYALPVAEVENLLLLPDVFLALANALLCADPSVALAQLKAMVMHDARANLDLVSARYTTRQLDRRLKRVEVSANNLGTLQASYTAEIASIDPATIFNIFRAELDRSIDAVDLTKVLELYDNKGLLAQASSILGVKDKKQLLEKVGRLLGGEQGKDVREKLASVLPNIPVCTQT